MDCTAGSSLQHSEDTHYSLEDILKLFYFYGLTNIYSWNSSLEKIKNDVYKTENAELFELYIKLLDMSKKIKTALELRVIHTQKDLPFFNSYLFDIDEIYDYLFENIPNFTNKVIQKSTYILIFSYVRQTKSTSSDEDNVNNDDNMNICCDESEEDELDKIYFSLQDEKQEKKSTFFNKI